jgi:Flp pilus assembly protein CpaB
MTYRMRNVIIAVGLGVVAMFITLLYVTNYKRSVQHNQTQVQVFVAAHDIAAGTSGSDLLSGHALRGAAVTRKAVVAGAISNPAQIQSLIVSSPLYADEQVTLRHFTDVAAQGIRAKLKGAMRAVQVPGDSNQLLAGTLQAGDHVDVVANLHDDAITTTAAATTNATHIVLRDVAVLVAPKQSSSPVASVSPNTQASVILAVSDSQATKLFFAMKNAEWTFALRPASKATNGPDQVYTVSTLLGGGVR